MQGPDVFSAAHWDPESNGTLASWSAAVLSAPYTHLVSRSSAGFQPAVSPISNRHGWRRFWARGKARKTSRLEALRYSRLETCATACGRSKMRVRCRVPRRFGRLTVVAEFRNAHDQSHALRRVTAGPLYSPSF